MVSTLTSEELLALPVSVDLVTAGRAFGIGRTKAHELARRAEFPCPVLRLGVAYRVVRADLLRSLGLDPNAGRVPDLPCCSPPSSGTGGAFLVDTDGDRAFFSGPEVPEVIKLSRQEYEHAIDVALAELGLTYLQLRAQARTDNFSSLRARKLWLAIGEQ